MAGSLPVNHQKPSRSLARNSDGWDCHVFVVVFHQALTPVKRGDLWIIDAILQSAQAVLACAVCATIVVPLAFHAVTDDLNAAARASRSKRVNGTSKTIEIVRLVTNNNLKHFVVFVSASSAPFHISSVLFGTRTPFGRPF